MSEEARISIIDSGKVTDPVAVGGNTLSDKTKNWGANVHKNRLVRIDEGAGAGQIFSILGNSSMSLTIRGSWIIALNTSSKYQILDIDLAQVLRDVLGGGSDISATNPLETHDPKVEEVESKLDFIPVEDIFTYLDAGGEQVVFTFTPTANSKLHTIWLDLSALTQNTTIRLKHQIDGVNYRTFETFNWTTGMDDGVYFREVALMSGRPVQVTMQEAADEGADRDIPYYYMYEER